jgi:hypothetical protein
MLVTPRTCKEKPLVIHKSKVENEVIPVFKYKIENQNNRNPLANALNNKYLIDASTPAIGAVHTSS